MDDRALFAAWVNGDRHAGATLFDRHYESILRFFHNKVDDASATDLVQATFLACVEARDRFRGDSSVRTFLFSIAHHVICRHFRARRRKPTEPLPEAEDELGDTCSADFAPSASTLLRVREEQRLVLSALQKIPIDCQVVLELHYWEDMDTAEIAKVVGVPVGTVKSRMQRGRRLLEEKLEQLAAPGHLLESTRTDLDRWARGLRGEPRSQRAGQR